MRKAKINIVEKIIEVIAVTWLVIIFGGMFFICYALVYEAWHYEDPPTEMQIRWDALDNEWDRNMHDPSQRPPDSIANEARLRMLLLEEEKDGQ